MIRYGFWRFGPGPEPGGWDDGWKGDADFEHARLLKIHTSVVVSARSVTGIFWFWAFDTFRNTPWDSGGGFYVSLLISVVLHEIPQRLHTPTRLYISTPGG